MRKCHQVCSIWVSDVGVQPPLVIIYCQKSSIMLMVKVMFDLMMMKEEEEKEDYGDGWL